MALFITDIEAIIYIPIIMACFYVTYRLISYLLSKTKKVSNKNVNIIKFSLRIIIVVIVVYFIIEGFPSFNLIDPTYSAILTGSISTALAFVSSEIFLNFMAGILLFVIDPFDIGDVVKIKGYKGVIISFSLTKVVLETFDQITVEIMNSDIISSNIVNYTIKLKKENSFFHFKKQVLIPQYKGKGHLDGYLFEDNEQEENELKELFTAIQEREMDYIHAFTFKMVYQFKHLRIKIDQTDRLCLKYKNNFGFKPRFHIIDFGSQVMIKFRILAIDTNNLFNYLPKFAKDLAKVILS